MSIPTSTMSRGDRATLVFILGAGVFSGAFIAGTGLITAAFRLIDPARYPVSLAADIPLATGPGVLEAHGDSLVARTDALSGGALWLLTAGDVLTSLTIGIVTATFGYVLWRVAQRRPFHRTVYAAVIVTGAAVALGSILSQGIGGLGRMLAANDLHTALDGVALIGFDFSPLPVIVGFGILGLAFVFRTGAQLQRETEGLI